VRLRPVPTLTVDFGDGRRTVRTLHGSVATFVCAPDGTVVDALPGLYDAPTYRAALEGILDAWAGMAALDPAARAAALDEYHGRGGRRPALLSLSKFAIEMPAKSAVARAISGRPADAGGTPDAAALPLLVARDARDAEDHGRDAVHAILREAGPARPEDVAGRLFREVLGFDLDDPLLGLGPVLAGEDPLRAAGER
jgi:hypothetical protein